MIKSGYLEPQATNRLNNKEAKKMALKCEKRGNREKFLQQYAIMHTAYVQTDTEGIEILDTYYKNSDDISEWSGIFCGA